MIVFESFVNSGAYKTKAVARALTSWFESFVNSGAYSSMANCYGGVIILGVVENPDGSFYTTGLKNAAKMKKNFWDTINNQTKVSVNLLTDENVVTYDMNGDVIMVIYVPRARRESALFISTIISGTGLIAGIGRVIITALRLRSKPCFATSRKKPWT